ncbi:alpha,alpha-trehalase TreF [Paraburkholderia kururiensis]|uniref:alpha,alpha-trehalase TreF n=1 Tax=Paraburkholderia kururiensis TaxID=984307 RepID=UPI000F884D21|nr:alpha,alpha-trehalase TreF [Paraburkholderia kururiensis]
MRRRALCVARTWRPRAIAAWRTALRGLRHAAVCLACLWPLAPHAAGLSHGFVPLPHAVAASAGKAGQAPNPHAQPSPVVPVPPSELYGDLYREVELARVFPDSKTFADMEPSVPPQQVMAAFAQYRAQHPDEAASQAAGASGAAAAAAAVVASSAAKGNGASSPLAQFVARYFTLPERQAKNWTSDPNQDVTSHIDTLWNVLRRNPDRVKNAWSSLLPLPKPYIVPGDRFDEIYYWDSYFIMLGLETSGRHDLTRDELDNFAALIDRYGHIPNGNRTYYLSRSQPPFFAQMVELVAQRDGDAVYLRYLPELKAEYAYWMEGSANLSPGHASRHLVRLADGTLLNRYWDERDTPRDESYREDVLTAQAVKGREPASLWRDLRAGGETGWDFSSRWFADGKTLASIEVTSLVPVDLNSLLYLLERTLAKAYRVQGDATHAENMEQHARIRADAIRRLLWDPQLRAFGDYDFARGTLTHRLSAATVYPLCAGVATREEARSVAETLKTALLRPGGLATTRVNTGQQWDEPNGWAPLQYLAVMGLRRYGEAELARTIATRWIRTNVAYYQRTGKLVEKYDVDVANRAAGGGEYPLQDGFGWTNGVLRALMKLYPDVARNTRPTDVPEGPSGVSAAASAARQAPKTSHRLQAAPAGAAK